MGGQLANEGGLGTWDGGLARPGSCRIAYLSGGFSVTLDSETGVLGFKLLIWRCTMAVGPEKARGG